MAHFAELNENNIVTRVIVVSDDDIKDVNGVELEEIGIAFCKKTLGGNWKQTSYNNRIRVRYAGIGYSYDVALDAFVAPRPFPSFVFNPETTDWEAPVPKPELTTEEIEADSVYEWDEERYQANNTTGWVLKTYQSPAAE
jgi:hypothetical protein